MSQGLWIKISIDLIRHPKLQRLSKTLNESPLMSVGRLFMLWSYAMEFYPDGELNISDQELANVCQWQGDPEEFVQSLISCGGTGRNGFLIKEQGVFVIHDWINFSGGLHKKRSQARERMQRMRDRDKQEGCYANVTHMLRERSRTKANKSEQVTQDKKNDDVFQEKTKNPQDDNDAKQNAQNVEGTDSQKKYQNNQNYANVTRTFAHVTPIEQEEEIEKNKGKEKDKEKERPQDKKTSDAKTSEPFIEDFEKAWKEYPRKKVKKQAYKCYVARRRAGCSAEELYQATVNYAQEMRRKQTEEQFILQPTTFFGVNDRWLDYLRPQTQPQSYRQRMTPDRGDLPPSWHDVMPEVADALKLKD